MEYLSQYKYTITYINRDRNTVMDTLSHLLDSVDEKEPLLTAAAIFKV